MPITDTHALFDEFAPQWQRIRDALAGQDAVKDKERRESYVPRLQSQTGERAKLYDAYINRALWSGYSQRTVAGLVGAVFRKFPEPLFPEQIKDWLDDVTLTGLSLEDFARMAFREAMAVNWGGILTDGGDEDTPREERRPSMRLYQAEQIRNWRIERQNGVPTLVQLVLFEEDEEPAEDGFGTVSIPQYRVLELQSGLARDVNGKETATLTYTQQLYREQELDDGTKDWLPFGDPIIPRRRGEALDFIPFEPLTADGPEFALRESKILDLVDVNFDHFRLDADYKHGLHFTALPTAWLAGFNPDEEYLIGSQAAWVSEDPQARADYLEFTGAGLGAIVTAKESDEKLMAVLGARLLEEQKRAAEAADTVRLRQAGEESVVKTAARAVSASLSEAAWTMAWWGGLDEPEVNVPLNLDIVSAMMSPQMLTALTQAFIAGKISQQTYLEALVSGEIIQGRTWEEEQELIELTTDPEVPEVAA